MTLRPEPGTRTHSLPGGKACVQPRVGSVGGQPRAAGTSCPLLLRNSSGGPLWGTCQGPAVVSRGWEVVTRVTKTQTWFSQGGPAGPKAEHVND